MALNKNAYARFCVIDYCITERTFLASKKNILKKITDQLGEISERQLEYDFTHMGMEPFNAPVKSYRSGKQYLYKYIDPKNTLHKFRLPDSTLNQIEDSLNILNQMKGAPFLEPMLDFLEENLSKHNWKFSKAMHPAVMFDENTELKGLEYFRIIYDSIIHRKVLEITYREFGKEESNRFTISPYLLKNYNQRWFLFGKNHSYSNPKRIWNLPLDRIEKISQAHDISYINIEFYNWRQHFNEIIGVTFYEERQPIRIKLKFSEARLPYVKTKPIHSSQKPCVDPETGLSYLEIKVRPNRELIQKLLSFGQDLEVLDPPEIKNEMIQHLEQALSKYKKTE
jgi:predicted DNA-binding transcriptional regulator YafY